MWSQRRGRMGRVTVRVKAPNAREVALDQFGRMHPLAPQEGGMWEGTVDLGRGFQYFFLKIDGSDVLNHPVPQLAQVGTVSVTNGGYEDE